MRRELRRLPVVVAGMLLGSVPARARIGGVVGLLVGLSWSTPSTAWFAVLEIGVPAGAVGCSCSAVGVALWS